MRERMGNDEKMEGDRTEGRCVMMSCRKKTPLYQSILIYLVSIF